MKTTLLHSLNSNQPQQQVAKPTRFQPRKEKSSAKETTKQAHEDRDKRGGTSGASQVVNKVNKQVDKANKSSAVKFSDAACSVAKGGGTPRQVVVVSLLRPLSRT